MSLKKWLRPGYYVQVQQKIKTYFYILCGFIKSINDSVCGEYNLNVDLANRFGGIHVC